MSFKEITGQERAINFLKQAIQNNELPPAYLFLGIEGVGKRLTALSLAKALNCQKQNSDSCDQCPSCHKINNLNHPDIILIGLAEEKSFIQIEQIRDMQHQLGLKPIEGRRKIAIIAEADFLKNPEASNALLKTLEEPPGQSLIILTATNSSRIFPTIISRTQIIKFLPLKEDEIKKILIKEYSLPKNEALTLSRLSQGSIGKALQLKDKGILEKRHRVIDNLMGKNNNFWEEMFIKDAFKDNFLDALDIVSLWFRDLLVLKIGASCNDLVNWDRKEDLATFRQNYSLEAIDKVINLIFELRQEAEGNFNPKLLCQRLLLEIEGQMKMQVTE